MDGERIVVISENEPSFYIEDGSSVPPLVNLIITNIATRRRYVFLVKANPSIQRYRTHLSVRKQGSIQGFELFSRNLSLPFRSNCSK